METNEKASFYDRLESDFGVSFQSEERTKKVSFEEYMKRCSVQQFHNDIVRACFNSGLSYDDLCGVFDSVRFALDNYKSHIKSR